MEVAEIGLTEQLPLQLWLKVNLVTEPRFGVKSTWIQSRSCELCAGARGSRVKSIVREMNGEKVDIVRWFEDPIEQLAEALKPAVPQNVNSDRDKRRTVFRSRRG